MQMPVAKIVAVHVTMALYVALVEGCALTASLYVIVYTYRIQNWYNNNNNYLLSGLLL